jgi:hypothetical protein
MSGDAVFADSAGGEGQNDAVALFQGLDANTCFFHNADSLVSEYCGQRDGNKLLDARVIRVTDSGSDKPDQYLGSLRCSEFNGLNCDFCLSCVTAAVIFMS